jgi:23S rRNA pseudouridine1911/1915/1917 synthase
MVQSQPYILEETSCFAVVYKPPKTYSVPIQKKASTTLVDWFTANGGANTGLEESGLLHRLDFETRGLVLFAKNEKSFNYLKTLQDSGEFIKEYSAVCKNAAGTVGSSLLPGFPKPPLETVPSLANFEPSAEKPLIIESYFRPFGPGRKQVRPVIEDGKKHSEIAKDKGGFYKTLIIEKNGNNFTIRIKRGFRHQIRCHLCWIGFPILNDPLYSQDETSTESNLALCAHAIFFTDPQTGKQLEYKIEKEFLEKDITQRRRDAENAEVGA